MKRHLSILFQGLVLAIPAIVTLYILVATVSWFDGGVRGWLGDFASEIPGLGLLLAVIVVYGVGLLSHLLLFRRFLDVAERLIGRVPLVKTVYGSVRDLMGFLGPREDRVQGAAVRVEISPGIHMIGIRTTDSEDGLKSAVYLPFSYMLGGFLVFFPKDKVEFIEMTVEEALKFQITGGMGGTSKEGHEISALNRLLDRR